MIRADGAACETEDLDANDLFEEGLKIPISYLFKAGARDETLMTLIAANVRDPVVAEGDLYSLTACNDTGAAQLLEMILTNSYLRRPPIVGWSEVVAVLLVGLMTIILVPLLAAVRVVPIMAAPKIM